jgi:hypothetical protein
LCLDANNEHAALFTMTIGRLKETSLGVVGFKAPWVVGYSPI